MFFATKMSDTSTSVSFCLFLAGMSFEFLLFPPKTLLFSVAAEVIGADALVKSGWFLLCMYDSFSFVVYFHACPMIV